MEIAQVQIQPLLPSRIPDYLDYFDHRAFADNPDWAFCYCHFLFADREVKPWGEYSADENRQAVIRLIENGQFHGYLAYLDGQPIGWCNAAPKALIPQLRHLGAEEDVNDIGAIGCFVVAQPYRHRGVATRLLMSACEGFRQQGLRYAEGYPLPRSKSESANHFGPMKMFLAAGFQVHQKRKGRRWIVRKEL